MKTRHQYKTNQLFIAISISAFLSIFHTTNFTVAKAENEEISSPSNPKLVIQLGKYAFDQLQTQDKFGRNITYYLSRTAIKDPLPLVLFINGSRGESAFQKQNNTLSGEYPYRYILDPLKDRARLLVVEKPGIKLFEREEKHDGHTNSSTEYLQEYTLERWTEANNAAIRAAQASPQISKDKLLVLGHSDGGQMATHVAYTNPFVTHVASIAGGGPTQLFDLTYSSSDGKRTVVNSGKQIDSIYQEWAKIKADPHSISKFSWGHPYNRWSSFLESSSLDDLLHCKAKAYLVQGTADTSVPVVSFDVLRAELTVHRPDSKFERINGANHGLKIVKKRGERNELPNVIARIVNWFLDEKK